MKDLLKAVGTAKMNFPPIVKDARNPHFKKTYATLAAILGAVELPLLNQCVMIVHEQITADNGGWVLKTSLIHWESEESISTVFPVSGGDPQQMGSALTYARRYNIFNLLNLATEDDDGNGASQGSSNKTHNGNDTKIISEPQLRLLMATASERGLSDEQQKAIVSGQFGFASRKHITTDVFNQVLDAYKACNASEPTQFTTIDPEDIPY